MIVYGDPNFDEGLATFATSLLQRTLETRSDDVDALRAVLIQSGQIEQALEDHFEKRAGSGRELLQLSQRLTENAAEAFYEVWALEYKADSTSERLAQTLEQLKALGSIQNLVINFKVPEGFAFYALF